MSKLIVKLLLPLTAALVCSAQVTVTEYPTPTAGSAPYSITAGPDGNLWFTEQSGNIGRITPTGVITEFPVPTAGSLPIGITTGPDGNLWFTEGVGNKIGKMTTAGNVLAEYLIPTASSEPQEITTGPDGNLWFGEAGGSRIGRVTTSGVITEFPIPTSGSTAVTTGPDGNVWFTDFYGDKIGKIDPTTYASVAYPAPYTGTGGITPYGITTGPDHNLWFAAQTGNYIGQITTAGVVSVYPMGYPGLPGNSGPTGIIVGPDGNLWFTQSGTDQIAKITTSGVVTEYSGLTKFSYPQGIALGADGNLWFTEAVSNSIGKLEPNPSAACTISSLTISNTSWNKFNAPVGAGVWFNAHMGTPANISKSVISTILFVGGSLVLNATKYALPDGLVTFDPGASATPATTFNYLKNRWETIVNPNHLSDELFFAGAAIPIDANLVGGGKATVTYTVGTSDQNLSLAWQWSAAAYTFWPADWNSATIEPYHAGQHAGAPLNTQVEQSLIQGPRGGGGSNYTGSWSSTGSASCSGH